MITIEILKIYKKYGGDIDMLQRVGLPQEKLIAKDNSWSTIGNLIQDFEMISKNLVSEEYKEKIKLMANKYCDSKETIQLIKKMVN